MKLCLRILFALFTSLTANAQNQQQNSLGDDSGIADFVKSAASQPTASAEELAAPPPGQAQLLLVNSLKSTRDRAAQIIATAPDDASGKQSPLYPKCQTWKAKLDQFIGDRTHDSLFALIPEMATVLGRNQEGEAAAGFLPSMEGLMENCGPVLLLAMADHVTQQQAAISGANLQNFIKVFALPGFYSEASFEDAAKPMDAAGVMILDAATVVAQLKAAPWQQAQRFLSDAANAGAYFGRYLSSGDGLPVLKTKYAQSQSAIDAKFVELKNWVAQQEAAADSP